MHSETTLPVIPEGLEPLSPNPGGTGDPRDLVGRTEELSQLLRAVSIGNGAHVTGERRMGKTWLIKKLQAELAGTTTAIYVSAETSSLALFEGRLLGELRRNRVVRRRISSWAKKVGGELKLTVLGSGLVLRAEGSKLAPDQPVPRELDVLDLLSSGPKGPVVLIIDEITVLCHALGPERAAEFLSALRTRRQSGGPPLVIAGSIGLHHALDDFSPINDLRRVVVGPLRETEAHTLAARLLLRIGVEPTPELVARIVRETSAIPFYIHGVVAEIPERQSLDVDAIVATCIAEDTWNTSHYDTRLPGYYGPERVGLARAILDTVATSQGPLDIDTIKDRITARDPDLSATRDALIELLDKLEKDHYVLREGNTVLMSSPLLTRIWRHHRWLS
ncbi:MAG: ATP-binding protein [Micrococcales bacterium]|nr:ATP-binding protein [Micrococcales bacterium]